MGCLSYVIANGYPDAAKGVVGLSDVIIITLSGELCYNSNVRVYKDGGRIGEFGHAGNDNLISIYGGCGRRLLF